MKIIHTSDWHLGHTLYGYDRTDEFLDFFRQLKEIAIAEQPDALLVSGDIFDVSTPPVTWVKMFTDYILELHEDIPGMKIIITSGNHDSSSRIDVNRELWKYAGIHVIGCVKRENGVYDFTNNIIEIPEKGYVVAIPYINRAFMPRDEKDGSQEKLFFNNIAAKITEIDKQELPVILMAHLTVDGSDLTGHRQSILGNINSVGIDTFDSGFDYVALGHIHRAQTLDDRNRIRYSGSPLSISFDENYIHSVSIVNVESGKDPIVREKEIVPIRKLKTFPEEGTTFSKAIKALKKYPAADNSYIRLNICDELDLPSDCQEQAIAATQDKACRFCLIKYTPISTNLSDDLSTDFNATDFKEMNPREIADRFFRVSGVSEELSKDYISLLETLIEEYGIESNK